LVGELAGTDVTEAGILRLIIEEKGEAATA
jgi:hypothetical protein